MVASRAANVSLSATGTGMCSFLQMTTLQTQPQRSVARCQLLPFPASLGFWRMCYEACVLSLCSQFTSIMHFSMVEALLVFGTNEPSWVLSLLKHTSRSYNALTGFETLQLVWSSQDSSNNLTNTQETLNLTTWMSINCRLFLSVRQGWFQNLSVAWWPRVTKGHQHCKHCGSSCGTLRRKERCTTGSLFFPV